SRRPRSAAAGAEGRAGRGNLVPPALPRAAAEAVDRGAPRARPRLANSQRLVRVTDEEARLRAAADHVDRAADGRYAEAVTGRREVRQPAPALADDVVRVHAAHGAAGRLAADRDDRGSDRCSAR